MVRRTAVLLALGLVAGACGGTGHRTTEADRLTPPKSGTCRDLRASDVERPTNASPVVACSRSHTAQTFVVGTLPAASGTSYDDRRHGSFVYDACTQAFRDHLGADESLALRIELSWAWFRPSQRAWKRGARWYRCDVVGGPDGATRLRDLPENLEGLFTRSMPDAWLTCARGATLARAKKGPCSERHDWRAISTVKVGQPGEPYPGDRIVQVRSRDTCSDWIARWSRYPSDFAYGYTWFHDAEWKAGNRRSVCWARTEQ